MDEVFLTDPGDLSAELMRDLTDAETLAAAVWLARAAALIVQRVPSVPDRVANGSLSAEVVRGVQAAMVLRVLRNPDGRRQETESLDDFSRSWTIDTARSAGEMYLSDIELAALAEPAPRAVAGTIRLRPSL